MALALQSSSSDSGKAALIYGQSNWPTQPPLATEAYPGELAELRQLRANTNDLIDLMPAGVIVLDGDGIVVRLNKLASTLLQEPILGEAWFNVIQNSFQPRADDWHEVSLKDGRRVKLDIMPLENQPGQLILITDLTETRLLQDKIAQMQRLSSLGRMVSALAHQIRTPLSAAMLYGANLANVNLGDAAKEKFQSKLMARLHDLEQQVNDMLLFAKSGNNQVVEQTSLNQLVKQALSALDVQLERANATISLNLTEDDDAVLVNQPAIKGAIQNLVLNSIDIVPQHAELAIATYCRAGTIYLSIQDNGPGIKADLIDTLFDPFVTSRDKGTGLGLAVVKAVAQAHQGQVKLLSQAGESAHFCIELPRLFNQQGQREKK